MSYQDNIIPNTMTQISYTQGDDNNQNTQQKQTSVIDAFGNPIKITKNYQDKNILVETNYDSRGNKIYASYPYFASVSGISPLSPTLSPQGRKGVEEGTQYSYDVLNRITQIKNVT
jgi:hypothetical protein